MIRIVGSVFLFTVLSFVCMLIYFPVRDSISRSLLLKVDRVELLLACRQMIANYRVYTNDWENVVSLNDDEKAIQLWSSRDGNRYKCDPRLPEPIRALRPMYVVVGSDHMYVALTWPRGGRIQAWAEGAAESNRMYKGERIVLAKGLWYWRVE